MTRALVLPWFCVEASILENSLAYNQSLSNTVLFTGSAVLAEVRAVELSRPLRPGRLWRGVFWALACLAEIVTILHATLLILGRCMSRPSFFGPCHLREVPGERV